MLLGLLNQIVASPTPGLYTYSASHLYVNNPPGEPAGGSYEILVSVSDDVSTASAETHIIVDNAPPTVRVESSGNLSSGTIGLTAVATDPGTSDTETLLWTLFVDGIATQSSSGSNFSFAIPSSFSTLVAIAAATDNDGGAGSGSAQIVPIFVDNAKVTIDSSGITVSVSGEQPHTTSLVGADVVIVPVYGSDVTVDASSFAGPVELDGYGSNESLTGGMGSDLLTANRGANLLDGGPGNDTLVSNLGDDSLYGGSGNDVFFINPGHDPLVNDSSGMNTLNFSIAAAGITLNLGQDTGQQQVVDSSGDVVTLVGKFDALVGSSHGDNITLNDDNDLIYAGAGNNTISGGSGNNSIVGGSGNDIIYGGSGNTTISGGAGQDSILGGSGNDIIYGGSASSTLSGGSGNDSIFGGSGNDIIYGGSGNTTISGGTGNSSITGGSGNDIIYGGTGNTTITGGGGNTTIVGGVGNDIIYGGSKLEHLIRRLGQRVDLRRQWQRHHLRWQRVQHDLRRQWQQLDRRRIGQRHHLRRQRQHHHHRRRRK